MRKPKTNAEALKLVLTTIGHGDEQKGRRTVIDVLGIARQSFYQWSNGVPDRYIPHIAVMTDLPLDCIVPEQTEAARQKCAAFLKERDHGQEASSDHDEKANGKKISSRRKAKD